MIDKTLVHNNSSNSLRRLLLLFGVQHTIPSTIVTDVVIMRVKVVVVVVEYCNVVDEKRSLRINTRGSTSSGLTEMKGTFLFSGRSTASCWILKKLRNSSVLESMRNEVCCF
jgi:hypothetical protein